MSPRGHAFECRINAEDASARFLPSPARITAYREPSGPGVRVDSGVRAGSEIPEIYDPMVAKLIVWDVDRESARRRMLRALDEYVVEGPATLIPFHRWLLEKEEFIAGGACHALLAGLADEPTPIPAAPPAPRRRGRPTPPPEAEPQTERALQRRGGRAALRGARCATTSRRAAAAARPARRASAQGQAVEGRRGGGGASPDQVVTPMQGTVLKVARRGRPGGRAPATSSASSRR